VPWHSGAAQRSGAAALVGTEQRAKERMAKGREVERERESTMERGDGEEKEELASPVAIQGIRTGRAVYVGGG
jgi:hypothetical protein